MNIVGTWVSYSIIVAGFTFSYVIVESGVHNALYIFNAFFLLVLGVVGAVVQSIFARSSYFDLSPISAILIVGTLALGLVIILESLFLYFTFGPHWSAGELLKVFLPLIITAYFITAWSYFPARKKGNPKKGSV